MHPEQHTELDNLITMQHNLRTSANKGSNDAYDVHTSLTGYEPNFMAFGELNDTSGSFSYITQSSDLDMDDVTLGKLLAEVHRGPADYRNLEGVVSQSVVIVCRVSTEQGNLWEKTALMHRLGLCSMNKDERS